MPPETDPPKFASVSVVIPFYNSAATVPRALSSVFGQSLQPMEIIVVDDGSARSQAELLDRYLASCPGHDRTRLIHLASNRGPGFARNVGWEASGGQLVAFLDADDAWDPDKLAKQVAHLHRHPHVVAVGGAAVTRSEPSHRERTWEAPRAVTGSRRVTKWTLAFQNPYHTSSVVVRRAVPWRFANTYAAEDYYLWGSLVLAGDECSVLDETLSYRFKAPYGGEGLSGFLIRMQVGELRALRVLAGEFSAGRTWLSAAYALSLLKFLRRTLRVFPWFLRDERRQEA